MERDWQEKDDCVHFCWKCRAIAPVLPTEDGEHHKGCGNALISRVKQVTKEQYATMNDEEKQEVAKIVDKIIDNFYTARAEYLAKERANKPHCPMCKSTDFSKITTGSRMASIFAFGLASSSIGKQYKCNKCGHKW
ncbi:MAG: hypothetical protein J6K13_07905 [Clostridia bacterium]|nr:hypothetical protein [Clostridia bacterium]